MAYHRLRAVAQHFCNDDQQRKWENGDFDPCRSETPENFITKFGHIDYVAGATRMTNFMGIGLRVSAPQIAKNFNITSCDFVYLPFPFLSFCKLSFSFLVAVFCHHYTMSEDDDIVTMT